ncbi:hypothetical protein [Microbacterium arborescens]|uniref:hypothetical protein n=1 Tax=Microbacterium arborescens TaxID=33883 RepID=UPI003C717076
MIASLRRHVGEGVSELAKPGSPMRLDDHVLQPFQLSHEVGHAIAMALDALGTLEIILRDPSGNLRIPLFGIYPVARQALEAAAIGLWIAAPENPTVRRIRTLRLHAHEAREEASLIAEFLKERPGDDPRGRKRKARQRQAQSTKPTRVDRILEVATGARLDPAEVRKGVPSMRGLLDDVDALHPMPEAGTRAIWQYLSGLAHPSQLRAIQASDLELSATSEPGISHARMTAKEEMVLLSLDAALMLVGNLLDAVAECGGNPSLRWQRDDLAVPPGWRVR